MAGTVSADVYVLKSQVLDHALGANIPGIHILRKSVCACLVALS